MAKKVQLEREEKKSSKLFSPETAWTLGICIWRNTENQGGWTEGLDQWLLVGPILSSRGYLATSW